MLEKVVEAKLKRLEGYGFEVLKLRTPGYNGTKDRLILWPKWSPGVKGPVMVECKAPGKQERALQAAVREDWRARGCDVRDMVDTLDKVDVLCDVLLAEAVYRWQGNARYRSAHPALPEHVWKAFHEAKANFAK